LVAVAAGNRANLAASASLYAAFPAAEARRLVKRFEWHYTPKHGSWLEMAESELAVLTSQCLSRRIHRNKHHASADWQFTTENARVKLKTLGPQFTWLGRLDQKCEVLS
jgi:hypothetical protein